jgi:hypothetical protein
MRIEGREHALEAAEVVAAAFKLPAALPVITLVEPAQRGSAQPNWDTQ